MLQIVILVSAAFLVALDQVTKMLAVEHLTKGAIPLIDGVFELTYVQNTGAAFGLLKNQRWVFMSITAVVMVVMLVVLMSGRFRRYRLANIAGTLILAGGIGNMIDRVAHGYVVDFLYFKLINFPVFNVADCYVVIGAALLLIFFFFFYKEENQLEKAAERIDEDPNEEINREISLNNAEVDDGKQDVDSGAGEDRGET